jgi:hypothetical protein
MLGGKRHDALAIGAKHSASRYHERVHPGLRQAREGAFQILRSTDLHRQHSKLRERAADSISRCKAAAPWIAAMVLRDERGERSAPYE